MQPSHDSETLMQSSVARALKDLNLGDSPDAETLVLKELSSTACMLPVVDSIRSLPPSAISELFAAARARLDALAALARCDAALDALERSPNAAERLVEVEEVATRLSLLLRGAPSKVAYAEAVAAGARVLAALPVLQ